MTQNELILEHLKSGKTITPRDAINLFNCYRLAARISDLRQQGYDIIGHIQTKRNEDGELVRYSEYHLRTIK